MDKVRGPVRSDTYTLRTGDGPNWQSDPTSYVPGELLPLYVRVTRPKIMGKGYCQIVDKFGGVRDTLERCDMGMESAKYIGLLLYAVKTGDSSETKVGEWAIPLEEPARFWAPDDIGCDRKAVMHRYAEPKHFLERIVFRAPPAGTGPITFRALIKQGDTNMGAFYWPSAPSSGGSSTLAPSVGRSGGDLVLVEDLTPPTRAWSYRGQPGESCTTVCESRGLECDGDKLLEATSATALATSVDTSFLCAPPYLSTCSEAAPHMSGLGDGLCFYRNDDTCPGRVGGAAASCDAPSSTSIDDGLRLCPCKPNTVSFTAGRRLDGAANATGDAPCDPPAERAPSRWSLWARWAGHGAGGDPSRCPNQRAKSTRRAEATPPDSRRPYALIGGLCALAVGVALVAGVARAGGGRRRGGAAAALGLLTSDASAHNWLRMAGGSRAGARASTVSPCRVRTQFAYPHIQVNTNSTFVMEWATGHGGATDIVFIHAKDYLKLQKISHRTTNQYVREAPPEAFELFDGPQWRRNHVGQYDVRPLDTCGTTERGEEYPLRGPSYYQCTLFPLNYRGYPPNKDHPEFVRREEFYGKCDARRCDGPYDDGKNCRNECADERIHTPRSSWPHPAHLLFPPRAIPPSQATRAASTRTSSRRTSGSRTRTRTCRGSLRCTASTSRSTHRRLPTPLGSASRLTRRRASTSPTICGAAIGTASISTCCPTTSGCRRRSAASTATGPTSRTATSGTTTASTPPATTT